MKRGLSLLVFLLVVLFGSTLHANGRFPASNAVVFHPTDPNIIIVRVTFGLLVSKDAGATWKWICERGIGFAGVEDPTYVITPKGTLIAGTFEGATTSRDGGCDWHYVGGKGATVLVDLTMREDGEVLGISSVYDKAAPDKSLFANSVSKSANDGQSFEPILKDIDNTLLLESIEIARSDPKRVYVSAVRGEKADRKGVLLVSNDGGAKFEERDVGLIAGELAPYIADVDPTRADRVYIRTAGAPDGPSRLLVTDDAGKTFRMVHASTGPLTGFALTRDGSKVYAGGREGVQSASTFDLGFSKISSIEAQCLGASPDKKLWACSNEKSGFIIGVSENAGLAFDAKLHIQGIEPLACGAQTSVGKECGKEWPKLRRELGLGDDPAASSSAGSGDRGPRAPAIRERGGRTRRGSTASGALIIVIIVGGLMYYVIKRIRRGR